MLYESVWLSWYVSFAEERLKPPVCMKRLE